MLSRPSRQAGEDGAAPFARSRLSTVAVAAPASAATTVVAAQSATRLSGGFVIDGGCGIFIALAMRVQGLGGALARSGYHRPARGG